MTACLSGDGHSSFRFGNGSIGVLNRADPPATFVMLGGFQLGARGAQMLQRTTHVRLVGARGQVESLNCH